MLGENLSFSEQDFEKINNSLNAFIPTLSEGRKPIYQMIQKKTTQTGSLLMDGIGMRCLEEALKFFGETDLAAEIEGKRNVFQRSMMARLFN